MYFPRVLSAPDFSRCAGLPALLYASSEMSRWLNAVVGLWMGGWWAVSLKDARRDAYALV